MMFLTTCHRRASHAPYARGEYRGGRPQPQPTRRRVTADVRHGSDRTGCGTDNMDETNGAAAREHLCDRQRPPGPSRFIHVEQRRDVRRAPTDSAAPPGRNRDVVLAGIRATFP
jgi:hypothetical protein